MAEKQIAVDFSALPEPKLSVRSQCASLGLLSFGVTTMIGMSIHTEWAEKTTLQVLLGYALFYGGGTQLVAGVLELIRGNSFGGTAFSSYGAFWMGYWLFHGVTKANAKPLPLDGLSFYLGVWGLFTFCFFLLTLKKPLLIQLIFGTLFVTFFLLSAGVRHPNAEKAGGYMGMLCGFLAFYTGIAELALEEYEIALPGLFVWYKSSGLPK